MPALNENSVKPGIRDKASALFKKYLLLIGALLLSLLIWRSIRSQFETKVDINVPVTVKMSAGEVSLGTASPEKVSVTLEGSQTLLDNIVSRDLELELDTAQAKKEDNFRIWTLKKSDFKVPHWVKIKSFSPGKVRILLDKVESRKLPVEAVMDEAKLPSGYKVGRVTIEPKEVMVIAPSTKLDKLKTIRTLPIPLDNITHSFDCDQGFDSNKYSDIDFDRKNVFVQVEIIRANKTRTFKTLPVRILVPPASKQQAMVCEIVSSPTVDLDVSGAEAVINALRRDNIFVFADISEFQKPGLRSIDLHCAIDRNGITSFKLTPARIDVKLERISKR